MRNETLSTPVNLSMESFPPSIVLKLKERGAFYTQLADLLKPHYVLPRRKSFTFKNIVLNNNECAYVFDLSENKLVFEKGFGKLLGYQEEEICL